MKLFDILNNSGTTKSKELIEANSKISIFKYNALKRAIPIEWKTKLKNQETIPIYENNINRSSNPFIRINNIWKRIESVTSKNIYILKQYSGRYNHQQFWIPGLIYILFSKWQNGKLYLHLQVR